MKKIGTFFVGVVLKREKFNRNIVVEQYEHRIPYHKPIYFSKAITLEPKRHECSCIFCGHNPMVETGSTNGYCLCGHSCYQKGCRICGNYDIKIKVGKIIAGKSGLASL